jgi:hypothetical protein
MKTLALRPLATGLLLAGCIGLLQYHSIQFWVERTGSPVGLAWSLLLEGAALWLWSDRRPLRHGLGALATLLLLAGPLYQVSAPLLDDSGRADRQAAAAAERQRDLAGELKTLDAALAAYLANSASRQGWVARIDHTQARLEQLRAEQAQITAERAGAPAPRPWQQVAVIGMEALAIALFQLVAVLAIGDLREGRSRSGFNPARLPSDPAGLKPGLREREDDRSAPRAPGSPPNFSHAPRKPLRAVGA